MKFTYGCGQRPLEGYTLKRGIGRGGFGEVYYGVSDGGKEVALKWVSGENLDVELRGVAQCLNLKHPNLVGLYDLRTDAHGDHWVIMEYIAGESLSLVLSRHPNGVAPELAQQWFLALARAVGYLHDHGIVHRDLKPGNIFLENGVIKIGDYGLSKFISGSQRVAQTQSVGTVHYMAPEIGSGNYSKQIDIYAAGIVLYEMLTGQVPFDGETTTEILMKHLTAQPDLSKLPRDYVPIVARALAKDPNQRYASMADMARALEKIAEPVKNGDRPRPEVPISVPRSRLPAAPSLVPRRLQDIPEVLPADPVSVSSLVGELCGSLALAAVMAALCALVWMALGRTSDWTDLGSLFYLTIASSWGVLAVTKFWTSRRKDSWSRRLSLLAVGSAVGVSALWVEGWVPRTPPAETSATEAAVPSSRRFPALSEFSEASGTVTYFALIFVALRWWKLTDRRRPQRFSFAPLLATGCCSFLPLLIWPQWHGALALVLASGIVQLASPWEPPPVVPTARRMRLRYV